MAEGDPPIEIPTSEWARLALLRDIQLGRGGFAKPGFKNELVRRTASLAIRVLCDSVLLSGKIRIDDPYNVLERYRDGFIGACWHHRLAGLLIASREVFHRSWASPRTFAMISASNDGELVARIFRDGGGSCVRGSASRGGANALRSGLAELERGGMVFLTPDGPRGPAKSVKEGVVELARHSGKPVVPFTVRFRTCVRFEGSWDRFELPLPVGGMTVCLGEPIFVHPEEERKRAADQIRAGMEANTERADGLPGRIWKLGKPRKRARESDNS